MASFVLRHAIRDDFSAIRSLVSKGRVNPTGLKWERFLVATLQDGSVIGCGQVKPHFDGSRELASIVVEEEYRNTGVARMIIQQLLKENPQELFLMCRERLGKLYEKFGFQEIQHAEMPVYFQRVSRLAGVASAFSASGERLLVMRRDPEEGPATDI